MRAAAVALVLLSCGGNKPVAAELPREDGAFSVFVEGPCSRLSAQSGDGTTVLVYGETGYDLHGWTPGEPVAAAQSLAEVRGDRVMRRSSLLQGLPRDGRGYVPGDLDVGDGWLLRTTTRYARGGTGALFEKREAGYVRSGARWVARPGSPVTRPTSRLGALPSICPEGLTFVPIAHDTSPEGGVFIAGRCDDPAAPNPVDPMVFVAHGRPGARAWSMARVPETDELRGIINLGLFARRDDEVYLVAYEPFVDRAERKPFLAAYDGQAWRRVETPVTDGFMSVAGTPQHLYLAAGRRLYRRAYGSVTLPLETIPLPRPSFARVTPEQMHVHTVRNVEGRIWVETSYRVRVRRKEGTDAIWASALYTTTAPHRPIHCDAREPAESALAEVPE